MFKAWRLVNTAHLTCHQWTATRLVSHLQVALVFPNNDPVMFMVSFYGCLLAELVPVPIEVPLTRKVIKIYPPTTAWAFFNSYKHDSSSSVPCWTFVGEWSWRFWFHSSYFGILWTYFLLKSTLNLMFHNSYGNNIVKGFHNWSAFSHISTQREPISSLFWVWMPFNWCFYENTVCRCCNYEG